MSCQSKAIKGITKKLRENLYINKYGKMTDLEADLGPNTLKSIQIHYNYFDLSMITITLQLQDL